MHRLIRVFSLLPLLLTLASVEAAQLVIPAQIHYQGRVVVNGINFHGTGQFKFLLYEHTDSDAVPPAEVDLPLWSNASSAPADLSEPASAVSLSVTHGLYAVGLGDLALTNMAALPDKLLPELPHDQVFLRVWFNDGSGFEQLTPDQPVRAVPFALNARRAETVPDGSIGTLALAPGAVTAANLEPGAVSQLGNPSGSIPDALQIDALGHAGVGTSSPQAALHVTGGTNVTAPEVLSTLMLGNISSPVVQNGRGLLAVADWGQGEVRLYDITDPTLPVQKAILRNGSPLNGHFYDSIPQPSRIAFDPGGSLLVIVSGDGTPTLPKNRWITLVSVENAEAPNPTFLGLLEDDVDGFDDLDDVRAIALTAFDDRRLLVAASDGSGVPGTLSLIDVSEASASQPIAVLHAGAELSIPWSIWNLAVDGPLLAVADANTVNLIDLAEPESPQLRSVLAQGVETEGHTYTGLARIEDLEIHNEVMAIVSSDAGGTAVEGLTLVEVQDPSSPQHRFTVLQSEETPYLNGAQSVALNDENTLALGSSFQEDRLGATVVLFDISEPSAPVLLEEIRESDPGFGGIFAPEVDFAEGLLLIQGDRDDLLTIARPFVPANGVGGLVVEQRLGIGVPAPEAALHVRGAVRFDHVPRFDLQTRRVSMGLRNAITGDAGIALGDSNLVGDLGVVLGSSNEALDGAYVFGHSSIAEGGNAFSIGSYNRSLGPTSMVLGWSGDAIGENALAIGTAASSTADNAIAIGDLANASANGALALGNYSRSDSYQAIAFGTDAEATGDYSLALGTHAAAAGAFSSALGHWTNAPSYGETALGQFNTTPPIIYSDTTWDSRDRLLVVGNGPSLTEPSDILTIYKDGRLNYGGTISAVGDISTLSNFRYVFPRPRKYQVPAAAFVPSSIETDYLRGDGFIHYRYPGETTTGVFRAPVHLPDGATITQLTIYYFDNFEVTGGAGDTVYITNIQGDLRRMGTGPSNIASELVAATFSAGTLWFPEDSTKYAVSSASVALPVVENANYQYFIEVDFSVNRASSSLRFYGATIDYTQEVVAP
jgi:hypothetical protein